MKDYEVYAYAVRMEVTVYHICQRAHYYFGGSASKMLEQIQRGHVPQAVVNVIEQGLI